MKTGRFSKYNLPKMNQRTERGKVDVPLENIQRIDFSKSSTTFILFFNYVCGKLANKHRVSLQLSEFQK